MITTPTASISRILRAIHRPDIGQYGACTRCVHGNAAGQHCQHEYAGPHGQASAIMRGPEGPCRDGSLHEYAAPHHHPAQQALAFCSSKEQSLNHLETRKTPA